MKIDVLTLFPQMFSPLNESILKKAQEKKIVEINLVNIRDFSKDPHKKCDDYSYGGGSGMLMTPEPIYNAIMSVKTKKSRIIYLSPKGEKFSSQKAKELSKEKHLIFICGHYEGIDQRIIDLFDVEEISIGDYVLTGGELPAMVVIDSLCRFVKGVLGNEMSPEEESFSNGLLEYPQYTRPQVFMGLSVPQVLISGNHEEVKKFREEQAKNLTKKMRADLLNH